MGIIREQTLGMLTTPPKFGCGLSAAGNVPNLQRYDATTGSYEPNYTLTPLVIEPEVAAIDGELAMSSVNARTLLANIHWYELDSAGGRTEIVVTGGSSTPAGYTELINTEGHAQAGRLVVAKNAAPGVPLSLVFAADLYYGDDCFHLEQPYAVHCRDVTPSVRCKFDMPEVVRYNPIHDAGELPVCLRVWENGRESSRSHFIPQWEVRRRDGSWSEYGQEVTDYWLKIAEDGMSARLDMELMGDGVNIRVRLRYNRDGNPAGVVLAGNDLAVPMCRLVCVRWLGKYGYKLLNVTNSMMKGCRVVRPTMVFEDGNGEIADPDRFFIVKFYATKPGATLSEADLVGTGRTLDLPASRGNGRGLKIGYAVDEIGPLKAWADGDGTVLTDADGTILLIR